MYSLLTENICMIRTAQFIYNIIGFSLLLVNDYILTVAGLEMVIVCDISKNLI